MCRSLLGIKLARVKDKYSRVEVLLLILGFDINLKELNSRTEAKELSRVHSLDFQRASD